MKRAELFCLKVIHSLQIVFTEQSQSDSVQEIIESRRQNFRTESERRAAAAKERALQSYHKSKEHKDSGDVVFRAVPVSVVAEPTLAMSAKATGTERGRSSAKGDIKSAQSVKDAKKSFEAKAQEVTATTTGPLNRALQPRGSRQADAGSKPKESGARPKESGDKPKPTATAADKKKMGALTGR